jgi:hypothetical protein
MYGTKGNRKKRQKKGIEEKETEKIEGSKKIKRY